MESKYVTSVVGGGLEGSHSPKNFLPHAAPHVIDDLQHLSPGKLRRMRILFHPMELLMVIQPTTSQGRTILTRDIMTASRAKYVMNKGPQRHQYGKSPVRFKISDMFCRSLPKGIRHLTLPDLAVMPGHPREATSIYMFSSPLRHRSSPTSERPFACLPRGPKYSLEQQTFPYGEEGERGQRGERERESVTSVTVCVCV
jgi:hypothetical protein